MFMNWVENEIHALYVFLIMFLNQKPSTSNFFLLSGTSVYRSKKEQRDYYMLWQASILCIKNLNTDTSKILYIDFIWFGGLAHMIKVKFNLNSTFLNVLAYLRCYSCFQKMHSYIYTDVFCIYMYKQMLCVYSTTVIHSTYIKPILSNRFYIKWQSGMMIISKRFPFCLPKCFYNDKHWVALVNIWNSISCTQWFDFCHLNG